MLVSPNFLQSDFIAKHELLPVLDAARKEAAALHSETVEKCVDGRSFPCLRIMPCVELTLKDCVKGLAGLSGSTL